ncbi:hypothetical protein Lfu02_44840 [Longispora fulva]|uniref:Uncharacterized protein n=1 Tax=Longispora fulva TaxID=619741 RepID=A0A8J7GJQ9_9ACTN|nr:hypothetical protein [Longispora fulva]MBG6137858.1 hypothetical protein [Longispora fulva]GIG60112.1 hypothetical protein Lfu02_44840 [Longispora fulva]
MRTPRCVEPSCYEGARERTRFGTWQVVGLTAAQRARVAVVRCATFSDSFHLHPRPGWRT